MRPLILSLLLLCSAHAVPDENPPTQSISPTTPPVEWVVPDLPSADMRLSWGDFRELLQLLQPAMKPEKDKPEPPWPWAVTGARYQLDATDGRTVRAEVTFDIEVWAEGWTTIPLLGNTVAVSSVQIDGEPSALREEGEWFNLLLQAPGHYQLEVSFFAQPLEVDGDVTLQFAAAAAPVTEVRLLLGADAAAVSSPNAARVTMESKEGHQEAVLALRPAADFQLHWRRPSRVKETAPPPPPRITAEIVTQVRLSEGLLEGTTQVNYEVLRGSASQFVLELPKGLVLLSVEGKGLEWTLEEDPETQRLQLALNYGASGAYPVTLRYERPLAADAGPVTLPNIVARDVARQGGIVGISAARNFSVEIADPTRGVTRTEPEGQFNLGLDWAILHAFRYSQTDYELTAAASVIEPRIVAETEMLASMSASAFHARANVHFQALRGETRHLSFTVPADASILSVEGPGMDWFAVDSGEGQRIEVALNEPLRDQYGLVVVLERNVESGEEAVSIPPITIHDVVRQHGWVGIAAAGNVKVDVGSGTEGLTRIDETELPAAVRAMADSPVLHAFEYQEGPFVLPVHITRLDDVAVRVAAIDSVEIATVLTDEMIITRARYWVRNNQRQFLRIDPGPAVEIWGAQVDGHVASPAKDPDSETGVLLRMRKSEEGTTGLGSFPMDLIYMQRPPATGFWRRSLALRAPATDILADRIMWTVYVPEGARLYAVTGDWKPAVFQADLTSPDRGTMTLGQPETIRRLREGIERFLITDINNPAGSAASQSKTFSDRTYPAAHLEEASVRLAGVLPVHVNLPQTGFPHRFERVLVPQGETLRLTLKLRAAGLERAWNVLCGLSVFLLALAIRFRARIQGLRSSAAWRALLAVLLIVAGMSLLQTPGMSALAALSGLAVAVAVMALIRFYASAMKRREHRESAT